MRPPGVRQRVQELLDDEWERVHYRVGNALRANLTDFVTLCGRQWYMDHPMASVLRQYRKIDALLADPSQARTHTEFETRCLACVEQLRLEIAEVASVPPDEISLEAEDAARGPILRIPPMVILGEVNAESYFNLVCWNEANSLVEGVQTPYRAARSISNMGYHQPADPYGLVEPLDRLAERYEDYPPEREATGAEIIELLTTYLTRAPWPRSK